MRRALVALPVLLAAPAQAAAAPPPEPLWGIKVVASGSYSVDYGDERLQPNQYTAVGVDGQGSGTWRWSMRAVGEGRDVDATAGMTRMSVNEQSDIVLYSIQMSQLSESEYCRVPGRKSTDFVRDNDLDFYRSGRGFRVNHSSWNMLSGCHVGSHGMSFYDGAAPSLTRVPRAAFNPRLDRSYSKTWTQVISLGREHESGDPGALHTFSASGRITITVKRISERTAKRRMRRLRPRSSASGSYRSRLDSGRVVDRR